MQPLGRVDQTQTVQKVCGGLEVARDLASRSRRLYESCAPEADPRVLEALVRATELLDEAVGGLQGGREAGGLRRASSM